MERETDPVYDLHYQQVITSLLKFYPGLSAFRVNRMLEELEINHGKRALIGLSGYIRFSEIHNIPPVEAKSIIAQDLYVRKRSEYNLKTLFYCQYAHPTPHPSIL